MTRAKFILPKPLNDLESLDRADCFPSSSSSALVGFRLGSDSWFAVGAKVDVSTTGLGGSLCSDDGMIDDTIDGVVVGTDTGCSVGSDDGMRDGTQLGAKDGVLVGLRVGYEEGAIEGH